MLRLTGFICALMLIVSVTGCAENKTKVAEGATVGGVLGAAVGGIIGYQSGHPYQGALIGGAVGAGGGAAVGAQMEKPDQEQQQSK